MPRSDATLAKLRKICAAIPGAEEFVSFGHPGWRVGKASFAFYEVYKGETCIVFKAELPAQQALVKSPRFFVAPYIGKHGWTSLRCSTKLDWKEIGDLIEESARLVAPKKRSKETPKETTARKRGSVRATQRGKRGLLRP